MPDSRDVFNLRREGQLDDAINLARQIFAKSPNDEWLIKAYGWTLHSLLIREQNQNNTQRMRQLYAEFNRLEIPQDDQLLIGKRNQWQGRVPADDGVETAYQFAQRAKAESKAGNSREALRIYREAMHAYPEDADIAIGLGWEIQRMLKVLIDSGENRGQEIRNLLADYSRLCRIERPGQLHSLILYRAAQAAEKEKFPTFIKFFKWWDPQYLREDDFERIDSKDGTKDYPGCVAHVIKGIYKTSKAIDDPELLSWAADFVGEHYEKFPEEEWFPYYFGKLLLRSGSKEEARAKLIPIVRRKRSEFWAWNCLADTYDDIDADLQLACLCRALQCRTKDDSFRVKVHEHLGYLLLERQHYAEAKYEIATALAIRRAPREKAWSVPDHLLETEQADWYVKTATPENNHAMYEQHVGAADAIILADLPESPAVVSGMLSKTEDHPAFTFIACNFNKKVEEYRVKTKQHPLLHNVNEGTPVLIRLDRESNPPAIVSVKLRDGQPWDVYPPRTGVVVQINREKNLTVVATSKDDVCLLHHDRFPATATLRPGQVVDIGLRHDTKHDAWKPLYVRDSDKPLPASWCRIYEGILDKRDEQPFGFVRPDIFCPPDLLQHAGASNGQAVKGIAILELNKKKGKYGYRSVTLDIQPA